MATQDDYIKTALRIPKDLHGAISSAANESGRSFNAEIIQRLHQSFKAAPEAGNFLSFLDFIQNEAKERGVSLKISIEDIGQPKDDGDHPLRRRVTDKKR